jgi:hypothetical protein
MAAISRRQALGTLDEGNSRVQTLFDGLGDDDMIRPNSIGGGEWSAKDLIGHLAFWEEIALVTLDAWVRGEEPPIEATFTAGSVDDLNAWNHSRKRSWGLDRVRSESRETHETLVAAIQSLSDEQWAAPRPFEGDAREDLGSELGGVLGAPGRPFGHAFAHLPDLEAFVEATRAG